jgi:hypothetical protein
MVERWKELAGFVLAGLDVAGLEPAGNLSLDLQYIFSTSRTPALRSSSWFHLPSLECLGINPFSTKPFRRGGCNYLCIVRRIEHPFSIHRQEISQGSMIHVNYHFRFNNVWSKFITGKYYRSPRAWARYTCEASFGLGPLSCIDTCVADDNCRHDYFYCASMMAH